MLDIDVKETRIYREVAEEAQQEGAQKGAVNLISRLLSKRFGNLTEDVKASISELSFETLETLAEAQLDFQSLSDLNQWLVNRQ